MKKLFIIPAIALAGLIYNRADAQIAINASFGPVAVSYNQPAADVPDVVYTTDGQQVTLSGDDFYYLPDVDAYYDVTDQVYVYFNGDDWIASAYLPGAYADFDWQTCRRFEVRAYNPFFNDGFYRQRYAGVRINDWNYRNGQYVGTRGGYNRGFDRGAERVVNQPMQNRTFDRPVQQYRPQAEGQFENRQPVQNNNRGFNQPVQAQQRGFDRAAQPYRPQGGAQFENKAEARPAFQNNNRGMDNRASAGNFSQGRQQGRFGR